MRGFQKYGRNLILTVAFWGQTKARQKCAARWAELTVLFCRYLTQKAIVTIQFLSYFFESPHQVDMKNIVKSSKHFFGYFNTLKTHSACIALASNEMILLSTHSFCCTIWLVCMYSNTHFSVFCNFKWPKNCCLFLRKLGQNSTLFCCKDTLTIVKLNLVTFISWSKIFSLI